MKQDFVTDYPVQLKSYKTSDKSIRVIYRIDNEDTVLDFSTIGLDKLLFAMTTKRKPIVFTNRDKEVWLKD